MSRMSYNEALVAINRIRSRGISKGTVSDGLGSQDIPKDEPFYLVAQITGILNNSTPSDLPCYSFKLWNERDPTLYADPNDMTQAIFQDDNLNTGDFDLIDPSLLASDGTQGPISKFGPAFEMSGNVNVPIDGSAFVLIWPAKGARHFIFSWTSGIDDIFPAYLEDKTQWESQWIYSYTKDSYAADYTQTPGVTLVGIIPAYITSVHTQTSDGLNPDIITVMVTGATGGSFTINENGGGAGADIAYNASDGTINGGLATFTVASSTSGNVTTHVFTANSGISTQTLVLESAGDDPLQPTRPNYAAAFRNNVEMDTPVLVHLKKAFSGPPSVTSSVFQSADPKNLTPCILHLDVYNPYDGSYKLRFLSTDAWQTIKWNATASDIQTALSMLLACTVTLDMDSTSAHEKYTITITADYANHTLLIDKTNLVGSTWYVVVWSNGNVCTAAFGGEFAAAIPGWGGPPTPTLTVSPAGSSAGPWVVTIVNGKTGSYQIKVDSSAPVSTSATLAATLSGFSISGSTLSAGTLSYTLTATSGSHTLIGYGALLRSTQPRLFLTSPDGKCSAWIDPSQCP